MQSGRNITPEQILVLINAFEKQGELVKALHDAVAEQQKRLSGLDAVTNMHTQQIATLVNIIGLLGVSLFSTSILSREAAEIIREAVLDGSDSDIVASEGVQPILKVLDLWLRASGSSS